MMSNPESLKEAILFFSGAEFAKMDTIFSRRIVGLTFVQGINSISPLDCMRSALMSCSSRGDSRGMTSAGVCWVKISQKVL